MTPLELVDELIKFLRKTVKDYNLETKLDGIRKAPDVYSGYLPSKTRDDDVTIFPYIIVRFLSEEDSDEDTVNIRLIIGTYSEDDQDGWRDVVNIATRIKIALKKVQVIGSYSLGDKIKIELFEEQPFPQWFATMDLSFTIPQVQLDWSEHGLE